MTSDLQLAVELAEQAGRLTLDYFSRKSLQVFTKRDATPVTEADRKAESSKSLLLATSGTCKPRVACCVSS